MRGKVVVDLRATATAMSEHVICLPPLIHHAAADVAATGGLGANLPALGG